MTEQANECVSVVVAVREIFKRLNVSCLLMNLADEWTDAGEWPDIQLMGWDSERH